MTQHRLTGTGEDVGRSLGRLVVTLLEVVRQVVERQAVRRAEAGDLSDEQIERLGRALMQLEATFDELIEHFGVVPNDVFLPLDLAGLARGENRSDRPRGGPHDHGERQPRAPTQQPRRRARGRPRQGHRHRRLRAGGAGRDRTGHDRRPRRDRQRGHLSALRRSGEPARPAAVPGSDRPAGPDRSDAGERCEAQDPRRTVGRGREGARRRAVPHRPR